MQMPTLLLEPNTLQICGYGFNISNKVFNMGGEKVRTIALNIPVYMVYIYTLIVATKHGCVTGFALNDYFAKKKISFVK